MKTAFDRHCGKYDAWYDRNRFAYLSELKVIKTVLPKKGTGLEIGVGTGRFAASLGIRFGIDPSESMLQIAAQRGVRVRRGYGEKLPFADSCFDYIAIIITLAFTRNPAKVLKEAKRVLKKNSKIVIGIVDKDSFLGKFYKSKKSVFYRQARLLSVEETTKMLKALGFKRITCQQAVFQLPAKIDDIEKPRAGCGKGGFVVISAVS